MSTDRKTIRQVIAAQLVAADTAAEDRVFTSRAIALAHQEAGELPAVAVYTALEDAELATEAPREYRRDATLAVEAILAQADSPAALVDDDLDDLLAELEAVLFDEGAIHRAVEAAGGHLDRLLYLSTEFDVDARGFRLLGSARLTFLARYHTEAPESSPDPGVTPFETAHVEYDFAEPDGEIEATDTIELPQS